MRVWNRQWRFPVQNMDTRVNINNQWIYTFNSWFQLSRSFFWWLHFAWTLRLSILSRCSCTYERFRLYPTFRSWGRARGGLTVGLEIRRVEGRELVDTSLEWLFRTLSPNGGRKRYGSGKEEEATLPGEPQRKGLDRQRDVRSVRTKLELRIAVRMLAHRCHAKTRAVVIPVCQLRTEEYSEDQRKRDRSLTWKKFSRIIGRVVLIKNYRIEWWEKSRYLFIKNFNAAMGID